MAVLDPETILPWCRANNIPGDYAQAVKDPRVADAVLKDIEAVARNHNLPGFKIPKDIIVEVRDAGEKRRRDRE